MAIYRFGSFELDTSSAELWDRGLRVPLRPQPCAALAYLVARQGKFVSRQELYRALWPDGVHVQFDHGVNSCMKQIRAVLGDSRRRPRYIETLTRRGYRFIAPVRVIPQSFRPAASMIDAGGESHETVRFAAAVLGYGRSS